VVTLQQKRAGRTCIIGQLLDAWKKGNVKKLDGILNEDMDKFPALRKALFDDRHANWMPQIETLMRDGGDHVVVVGAAHLVGKGSVIDLLRAEGRSGRRALNRPPRPLLRGPANAALCSLIGIIGKPRGTSHVEDTLHRDVRGPAPIVQGGMQWVGRAQLVAAVANAGAPGLHHRPHAANAGGSEQGDRALP
jgi:hypothetical protein